MDTLDLQQLQLLLFLFVGLVILTLVGLAVYVVMQTRRRQAEAAAALQEIDDLVLRPSFLVVGQVLALVRDEPGDSIQVEIDGTKYRTFAEIKDSTLRRQVVDVAQELIQYTGVLGQGTEQLIPLAETETWREDMREGSQDALNEALEPQTLEAAAALSGPATPPASEDVEEQFLDLLAEMGQGPQQPDKPSLTSSIQRTLNPKPAEGGRDRSFVDDIEGIVQRRVQLIPALVGRGLHVQAGQGGKVIFAFEGQKYEGLDDIPNLTAQQVVKESIQEWNETN